MFAIKYYSTSLKTTAIGPCSHLYASCMSTVQMMDIVVLELESVLRNECAAVQNQTETVWGPGIHTNSSWDGLSLQRSSQFHFDPHNTNLHGEF